MRKRTIQKLTMLAFIVMASIPAFAQGGKFGSETNAGVATSISPGHVGGDIFDYQELRYYVKSNDGILDLEVIGLASQLAGATGDETLVTSEFGGTVTIPHKLTADVAGQAAEISSIAANAFTTTVLYPTTEGGKNATDSKDNFTAAAELVTKIIIDYNAEATAVAGIGANAFAGLTALTEVKNLTPGANIAAIPTNSFAATVFSTAQLVVPAGSMQAYAAAAGWKKFVHLENTEGLIMGNVAGSGPELTISDARKLLSMIGSTDFPENADLNGDGQITISDYRKLLSMIE